MGLLQEVASFLRDAPSQSLFALFGLGFAAVLSVLVIFNVLRQLLFKNPNEPPVVFHWFPFVGSTVTYGIHPYKFFFKCRAKYGDTFTFILLGKKVTVCLGPKGSDTILNGKLKDVCAEDVYSPLTTPVFGSDVVYDCPNAKLMEQKKVSGQGLNRVGLLTRRQFVKYGLTTEALRSYVTLIQKETQDYAKNNPIFQGESGTANITDAMAELTLYTASRSLQGKEVREKFDATFADLFHALDQGFSPINFMLPWAPLPHNKKRDIAREKMVATYMDIIRVRRKEGQDEGSEDMIRNLMNCVYKDGTPVPDKEVAHMMIALLMAGQHSSSATTAWIMLHLADRPDIVDELLEEQRRVLGSDLPPLTYDNMQLLPLHTHVVKETLRIHVPIHSVIRNVKSPVQVEGTPYTIPSSHWALASPGASSRMEEYFPNPLKWDPHRWEGELMSKVENDEKVDYGYGMISKGANSPYLPFGAGRHRCIGEQFAYLQIGTIVATWVRLLKMKSFDKKKSIPDTDYSVSP